MAKRVLKGHSLPSINAVVDLCNAVSLEQVITLGAHDVQDIHKDLEVRFATGKNGSCPWENRPMNRWKQERAGVYQRQQCADQEINLAAE